MCEPVSTTTMLYASLAMSAASAGMSYMQQSQQASDQADYQNRQAAAQESYRQENARRANSAYIEEAAGVQQQLVEKEIASGQEIEDLQEERLREQGALMANSEAAGLSMELLTADFHRQEAGYRDRASLQMELDSKQAQQTIKGFRAKAEDRGNSVRPYIPEPVSQPSLAGAGLQFAGGAVSAYGKYGTKKKP